MDNQKSAATAPDELRLFAEERLKTKPLPRSEMNTLRLLHELQVHQIELEMQNEELRQAKNTAETLQLELNELNKTLEQRVEAQVVEIQYKDQMLIRQTRQAAMGQMIDNIAHQWRQPLNSLGLTIQQIPFYYETKDFNREFLEECSGEAMETIQHMSQTIDDFKNFFKIDKEKIDFEIEQIIQKTVSLVKASFRDQHISITVDCGHNLYLSGFPNEYSQVILIILNNARDVLAERRNINGQVVIKVFKKNDATVMTFTDNAGGIPEDIIDKIFEPYFTTKAEDKGTGIGLFMAKNIIENSFGGRLTARNTGDGAEFRIEL